MDRLEDNVVKVQTAMVGAAPPPTPFQTPTPPLLTSPHEAEEAIHIQNIEERESHVALSLSLSSDFETM